MSRLSRYNESLTRFIKSRSCLFKTDDPSNQNIVSMIYNNAKQCDLSLPIMFLTLMNGQNKKNKISFQGYYAASAIDFLIIYLKILEDNTLDQTVKKDVLRYLVILANKSISQNLEAIKDNGGIRAIDICVETVKTFHEIISLDTLFAEHKFEFTNKMIHTDVDKTYFKENDELEKLKTFKEIEKTNLAEYLNKRIGCIVELTVIFGWIIGGSEKKNIKKLKKLIKHLTMIQKLANDFVSMREDIKKHQEYTTNFVINWGIIMSYELFMTNKEKFIEEAMNLDMYTNTVGEVVNYLQQQVDNVVEDSSPELKSSYSTANSVAKV